MLTGPGRPRRKDMRMRRGHFIAVCMLVAVATVTAQSTLRFEVASIRPTPDDNAGSRIGLRLTGQLAHYSGLTLKDYIGEAYRLDPPQVIAPDWMSDQR